MIDVNGHKPFEDSAEIAGIVSRLIKEWNIQTFVETGTQRGATALWANKLVHVITIEADLEYFKEARARLWKSGVNAIFGDSADVLSVVRFFPGERVLFFLDAHGCRIGGTPLLRELKAIKASRTFPVICIHDVQVPGHPELGWDKYEDGTSLSTDYVRKCLEETGFGKWNIGYNSVADGASRGFCYVTPPQ